MSPAAVAALASQGSPSPGRGKVHQSKPQLEQPPPQLSPWQIYRQFPGFGYFILDSLALGDMFFASDEK